MFQLTRKFVAAIILMSLPLTIWAGSILPSEKEALNSLRNTLTAVYQGETEDGFFCVVDTFMEPDYIEQDHQIVSMYVQNPSTQYFFAIMDGGVAVLEQMSVVNDELSFTSRTEGLLNSLTIEKNLKGQVAAITLYNEMKEGYEGLKAAETCYINRVITK